MRRIRRNQNTLDSLLNQAPKWCVCVEFSEEWERRERWRREREKRAEEKKKRKRTGGGEWEIGKEKKNKRKRKWILDVGLLKIEFWVFMNFNDTY